MLEVAEGIQYIHSEGIVHGDLSGVSVLMLNFLNPALILPAGGTSSSIQNCTAKSLISD